MSVSADVQDEVTIAIGGHSVASAYADEWSGRSLITVGNARSEIAPGRTPIEIDVGQGSAWAVKFLDPPPALDSGETISGQGQDVRFIDLAAGEWIVDMRISGNTRCYGRSCLGAWFDIDIGGHGVVLERTETWGGRKLLTVGDAYGEIRPGRAAIEVEADSGATWTLRFIGAPRLPVLDSDETIPGRGTDVRFVDLPAGEWIVEMRVSADIQDEVSIVIGGHSVAGVYADEWSGRSLVTVGDARSKISPGRTTIEIAVAQGAGWALKFLDPPPALDSGETISGQGQDVKFVDLTAGEWIVDVGISENTRCYGRSCLGAWFDIDIGGRGVVLERADTWSGRKLVTVGNGYGEIPPGRVSIEVEAESSATWTLKFIRQ